MCGVGREVVKLVRLYLSSFSLASCINSLSLSLARCNLSSQIRQVTFGKPGCKLTAVLILSGSSRRLCRLLYTRYAVVTLLVPAPPDNAPFNLYPPLSIPLDSTITNVFASLHTKQGQSVFISSKRYTFARKKKKE